MKLANIEYQVTAFLGHALTLQDPQGQVYAFIRNEAKPSNWCLIGAANCTWFRLINGNFVEDASKEAGWLHES